MNESFSNRTIPNVKQNKLIHCFALLLLIMSRQPDANAANLNVERFGFFETSFKASDYYANPFTDLDAEAKIKRPDGSTWSIPLFWDGGNTWKLRLSPDITGDWSYTVHSKDKGLDGKSGSFACTPSNRQGSFQQMNEHGHHFSFQDETAFLFWGDTAWGLYLDNTAEQLDRKAVFRYIDKRSNEGIDVVHSMLLSEAAWGNSGGPPFKDMASQQINPAYWQEIDVRLKYLNDKGIIGGLVLAWGDKQRKEPWAWRMFPNLEARKRYARYIAARYGAFNVYFIISGEWHAEVRTRDNTTEKEVKQEFIEIGNVLAQADAHSRMIGIHPMTRHGSVQEFNETDWMSFGDYQQNYTDLHERILQSRRFNKPIVNSEYGYFLRDLSGNGKVDKPNSFSPDDMRFATWDIIMAGGYPVTGYGTTYMGGYRDPGPFNPDDPRNDIWAEQYRLAKHFLTGLEWWKLQPLDDAIHCSQPRSQDRQIQVRMSPTRTRMVRRPPMTTYWLLVQHGQHYVAYLRGISEPVKILLGNGAVGSYRAQLFDPRTGAMSNLVKTSKHKDSFTFTPPDERDWVVHLINTSPL
ncbi:DUF4038 domain-containing protein [Planctomycetota bacterium]